MKLILLHGRSQEDKDPEKLRYKWVVALHEGAAKGGLELPIDDDDIVFPYFGDALRDLTTAEPISQLSGVQVVEPSYEEFRCRVLNECLNSVGITEDLIAVDAPEAVRRRGPLSIEWVQRGFTLVDKLVPGASFATLSYMAEDVAIYLQRTDIRQYIDNGVAAAFQACEGDENTVVVAHSFGSVVAYRLLVTPELIPCPVKAFITIGSPLGITAIREALEPIRYPPTVGSWFNAYDDRDAVALVPLNERHFPGAQPITNYVGVENGTPNHHGIQGYLSDRVVATRIVQALREAD